MRTNNFFYCPSCGALDITNNCFHCNDSIWKKKIAPIESFYTYEHYIEESRKRFGDPFRWREIFEGDELVKNPQFNVEKSRNKTWHRHRLYLCPICAKHYNNIRSPERITCTVCENNVTLYESAHDLEYYHIRSMVLFGDFKHSRDIIIQEELQDTPMFDKEEASKITVENQYAPEYQYRAHNTQNTNIPKCPTCQSTDIKKISALKRETHGFLFGIFNKTAFSQFECENCGYKW